MLKRLAVARLLHRCTLYLEAWQSRRISREWRRGRHFADWTGAEGFALGRLCPSWCGWWQPAMTPRFSSQTTPWPHLWRLPRAALALGEPHCAWRVSGGPAKSVPLSKARSACAHGPRESKAPCWACGVPIPSPGTFKVHVYGICGLLGHPMMQSTPPAQFLGK